MMDFALMFNGPGFAFLRRISSSFQSLHTLDGPPRYTFPAALLFLLLVFHSSRHHFSRKGRTQEIHKGLQALLTVITPTSSPWTSEYSALIQSKTIKLPLSNFIRAMCNGTMELRNSKDLQDIFSKGLRVYGWLVCLDVELSWWLDVALWLLSCHFRSFLCITMNSEYSSSFASRTSDSARTLRKSMKTVSFLEDPEEIHGAADLSLALPLLSRNPPFALYLDFVPHSQLEASIQKLQVVLRSGASTTLEFTTLSPDIPFLSTSFILSSLPFLPRKYVTTSPKWKTTQRTTTPLLTSLHRIMELLTSTSSKLIVESVQNVSASYVARLRALERELEDDRSVRTAFIRKWSVEGWREHRLMIAWEAGLLSAGYLTRWIIVVRK